MSLSKHLQGCTIVRRLKNTTLDHNFWTWNPSRSSKVSKDWDF